MQREAITVPGRAPSPILSYVVKAGSLVWTAGHVGRNMATGETPDDIQGQARNTMENLGAALAAAGTSWDNVIKVNVFLADINDRNAFNKVYLEYVPSDRPARTAIGNAGFEGNTLVEVECVAVIP